jgi:hypothetical protein
MDYKAITITKEEGSGCDQIQGHISSTIIDEIRKIPVASFHCMCLIRYVKISLNNFKFANICFSITAN